MEKDDRKTASSNPMAVLSASQKYAAGALFAIAVHRAQIHQTLFASRNNNDDDDDDDDGGGGGAGEHLSHDGGSDLASEETHEWIHHHSGLLRPIFKFLEIESKKWGELEELASAADLPRAGSFVKLLGEENGEKSSESADEVALAEGIDAVSSKVEKTRANYDDMKEKQTEWEQACREKFTAPEPGTESKSEASDPTESPKPKTDVIAEPVADHPHRCSSIFDSDCKPLEEATMLTYPRKITVLYQLLSACLANLSVDGDKSTPASRKGYDARHRVALRLLAAWFDVKWIKMEAIETTIACSAMAILKEEESKQEDASTDDTWAKWKRGGIIGAAALTGGTLMAITGGLAAPAIAAGFSALAPTVGAIIPVVGASGCAFLATAAGSAAGSVAVAASFGAAGAGLTGSKMAKRISDVEEFEFKAIGENHNQGRLAVEILVSGFVYEEEDFMRPWEGYDDNLERYVVQWESKHLIPISNAIQDWVTSKISREIMKQGAMMTALSTLVTAVAWPATLLSLTKFIDSKWAIAIDRSDKAGKLLAEVLQKGLQGHRPVTLVGFSLGARVIFSCLQTLAETHPLDSGGIVERVVLMGAPVPISDMNWETTRKAVSGRYVNAYSTNDWMLGIAFRATLLSQGLAGIQAVEVPGIQNVDVSEMIDGHSAYLWGSQQILEQLQLDSYHLPYHHIKIVKSTTRNHHLPHHHHRTNTKEMFMENFDPLNQSDSLFKSFHSNN
ncbi:uncharacterized protein LOC127240292 [Andrographis paniculata]|uniref:uncharacterized protein LOC127240292 n=1 Tax=Andrographis paniculata TaxID=175694 RepID=UPI0021E76665|nr:uncharacterized protein LOC127240292 [Andrographis paniculata]